ncbi:PhaM family polyhydroxyalkanoate granule multifunctional regulatory protein [Ottowia caeni]|uniref:PhaM family polyhydroxyalkanoate granule multifunctional regulatory protein n=1 Tax=Ottowia caeni TaxID=2870339 RepID=UPI001E42F12C|nr:hypothetical protein [Ottowia caeni]
MSDPGISAFGKFIPGFDFLQNLVKSQATAGKEAMGPLGGLGNWVAPTVSEEELEKRIKELKAVLFWLEQNSTALKATIQALEVQKMTLATLAGMNMSMAEVAKAFTVRTAPVEPSAQPSEPAASQPWPFGAATSQAASSASTTESQSVTESGFEEDPEPEETPEPSPQAKAKKPSPSTDKSAEASAQAPASGAADPLQWWGALTNQFQQIAANAMREAASQAQTAAASATSAPAAAPASQMPRKSSAGKATASAKTKKPAAGKAATSKTTAKKAAAKKAAPPAAGGWPLPPPFKRR